MSSSFNRTTNALARDNADSTLIALGVATLLILIWLGWFLLSRVTIYESSHSARLEAGAAPWLLSTSVPGKVIRNHLVIGRHVRRGEPLLELDGTTQGLRVSEEAAMLTSLQGRASALRGEIAALDAAWRTDRQTAGASAASAQARLVEAEAGLALATDTDARMAAQSALGGVSELDARRARADALKLRGSRDALIAEARRTRLEAQARLQQSGAQIDALRGELAQVEGEIVAKQAEVDRLQVEARDHVVRAPVDGIVGEVTPLRPGTPIGAGTRLATIVPNSRLLIVANFEPGATLGRLRPGQYARMELDGFPWAQFGSVRAKVVRVAAETRNAMLRVELVPAIDPRSPLVLRHGLTGRVEVSVERVSPVTLMLRSAGLGL